ncbi:MAG: hypothetical protein EDQ89_08895 [Acidobacteria bacterium]|nr:MAG: hypothetical protein EDQ89_08895 [Acidobacteriota bacterium]
MWVRIPPPVSLLPLALAATVAVAGLPGPAGAAAEDVDCSDFSTQAAAQRWFDRHGPGDPANLDGDGDGVACESSPCPCAGPGGGGGGHAGVAGGKRARVLAVVDGDTITVRRHGRRRDVRLIGIDTPEVYSRAECGGAAAARSMGAMLSRGDRVRLLRDPSQDDRDRYGRLLRYVVGGGRDVGRKQLHRGWARVYVLAEPFARVGSYRRQRDRARRHDRGVWGRCGGRFHQPR